MQDVQDFVASRPEEHEMVSQRAEALDAVLGKLEESTRFAQKLIPKPKGKGKGKGRGKNMQDID
eukprot:2446811-Prorocentrum_lima.AAC.1